MPGAAALQRKLVKRKHRDSECVVHDMMCRFAIVRVLNHRVLVESCRLQKPLHNILCIFMYCLRNLRPQCTRDFRALPPLCSRFWPKAPTAMPSARLDHFRVT